MKKTGAIFISICQNDLCSFILAILSHNDMLSSCVELLSSILFQEIKSIYSAKCILMSSLLGKIPGVIFVAELNIALCCTLMHLFYSSYLEKKVFIVFSILRFELHKDSTFNSLLH